MEVSQLEDKCVRFSGLHAWKQPTPKPGKPGLFTGAAGSVLRGEVFGSMWTALKRRGCVCFVPSGNTGVSRTLEVIRRALRLPRPPEGSETGEDTWMVNRRSNNVNDLQTRKKCRGIFL